MMYNGATNLYNSVFEELKNLFPDKKIMFTHGLEKAKNDGSYDIHFHYCHRPFDKNSYADYNLANNNYGDKYFFFPPKVRELTLIQGNFILIPDYGKGKVVADQIIEQNPKEKFKIIYGRDLNERDNVARQFPDNDIESICQGVKMILCVSQIKNESFGLLPLEMASSGIPTAVSDCYKMPVLRKTDFLTKKDHFNFNKRKHYDEYAVFRNEIVKELKQKVTGK